MVEIERVEPQLMRIEVVVKCEMLIQIIDNTMRNGQISEANKRVVLEKWPTF